MTRFLLPFLMVLLAMGCQTTQVNTQNNLLAPTAILLAERTLHHGVLNGNATLQDWVCLKNASGGAISIVLEIKKPEILGRMSVVNAEGQVVNAVEMKSGKHVYEVFDRVAPGKMSRCVVLQASKGLSVYSLRWRLR